jgi:hypothetical protein
VASLAATSLLAFMRRCGMGCPSLSVASVLAVVAPWAQTRIDAGKEADSWILSLRRGWPHM